MTDHMTEPADTVEVQPTEAGLEAARRYAGWHIGDRSFADEILRAYLNPEVVNADLDADDAPADPGWSPK